MGFVDLFLTKGLRTLNNLFVKSSGIGRCLASAYAKTGITSVTLADNNINAAQETATMVKKTFPHVKTIAARVDVVDDTSIEEEFERTFGIV